MKLPALITTDLHLTANPRDEYRWALWPWLRKQCEKEGVNTLLILGDVTDAKDYHPNQLVNRIVKEIDATRACVESIIIDQGNHDYLRSGHPLLGFLSALQGVRFVTRPLDTSAEGEAALFLPHTKTPLQDWSGFDWSMYRYVFMHQTVDGSIASNGQRMAGDKFPDMTSAGKIYSGDIHVPQTINGVEYVGSPYHVHFGDAFKPRCVLIDSRGDASSLHFRSISRITLDAASGDVGRLAEMHKLRAGDQLKVRLHLGADELGEWHARKRAVVDELKNVGVELFGVELVPPKTRRRFNEAVSSQHAAFSRPEDLVLDFVNRESLGADALDVGLELLE